MIELPIPPRVAREANPAAAELLKSARKYLWDGCESLRGYTDARICVAVYKADRDCGDQGSCEMIRHAISESLYPRTTYNRWVHDVAGGAQEDVSRAAIQEGRLRWMNQLIEEFGGTP